MPPQSVRWGSVAAGVFDGLPEPVELSCVDFVGGVATQPGDVADGSVELSGAIPQVGPERTFGSSIGTNRQQGFDVAQQSRFILVPLRDADQVPQHAFHDAVGRQRGKCFVRGFLPGNRP